MSAQVRNPPESDGPPFATIFRGAERCLVSGEGITIDSGEGREEGSFVGISRFFFAWQFLTTFFCSLWLSIFILLWKEFAVFFLKHFFFVMDSIFVKKSFLPLYFICRRFPFLTHFFFQIGWWGIFPPTKNHCWPCHLWKLNLPSSQAVSPAFSSDSLPLSYAETKTDVNSGIFFLICVCFFPRGGVFSLI